MLIKFSKIERRAYAPAAGPHFTVWEWRPIGAYAPMRRGGEKPIDLIRATRPVLIVDEPQSVDGIKYQRLGDEYYYAQELFEREELTGYLKNRMPAAKCIYEEVVYQRVHAVGAESKSWAGDRRGELAPP
jgi:hypothetical protein